MKVITKPCPCLNCDFRNLVFSCLDDGDIERVCENKEERHYDKGEVINSEGEKITDFKYLKSGLVKLYRKTPAGDEQIISITRPFEFVSNTHIFSEDHYKYSMSALEESVVCSIKSELIQDLLEKNGTFAYKLLTLLSLTSDKIISTGLDIRNRNLAGRVAYVLVYFAREIYHSRVFDLPVSRKEIADFISMSTANVIRTFSEFRRDGIINTYGRTIEIPDLDKLEIISRRG